MTTLPDTLCIPTPDYLKSLTDYKIVQPIEVLAERITVLEQELQKIRQLLPTDHVRKGDHDHIRS